MSLSRKFVASAILSIIVLSTLGGTALAQTASDGSIVRYGTMHEAIGEQQHQGRVRLSDLTKQPHFYAVAALEGLAGEVTIDDGKVVITGVDDAGQLRSLDDADGKRQATMLVGASVQSWDSQTIPSNVAPEDFDEFIADAASKAGMDLSKPFLFTIEGNFTNVRLHVIHGACPIHARMQKTELPTETRPFESDMEKVTGKIIGVFAKDAVGKLTHPATSTHMHLLFEDAKTGTRVTGHLEKVGLAKGAVLSLPK